MIGGKNDFIRFDRIVDRRWDLRGAGPGNHGLFTRRLFGVDRAGLCRRSFGDVARPDDAPTGTFFCANRDYELSDCLVNYWFSFGCSRDYPADAPILLNHERAGRDTPK